MPDNISSLASQLAALTLKVNSFDFKITSMQLTLNQFDTKFRAVNLDQLKSDVDALKQEIVTVTDDTTTLSLGQYLNGKVLEVSE